jgi:hypothetical protein
MHMTQGFLSSAPYGALRQAPRPFGVTRVQGLAGSLAEPTTPVALEPRARAANAERLVQRPVASDACDDDEAGFEWSEDAVVQLHWILLCELRRLADPHTPLDEKLDTLDWALTEPALDERPFSLANCIRVVGLSPLSPAPYVGSVDVEEIKAWVLAHAKTWLGETLSLYPDWVQKLIRANPHGVADRLAREPQWINQQIRLREEQQQQGDLFGIEVVQEDAR